MEKPVIKPGHWLIQHHLLIYLLYFFFLNWIIKVGQNLHWCESDEEIGRRRHIYYLDNFNTYSSIAQWFICLFWAWFEQRWPSELITRSCYLKIFYFCIFLRQSQRLMSKINSAVEKILRYNQKSNSTCPRCF
jgi:hypothetical protein